MEGIHQWILAVTAASVLTALCQALMPAGAVKRISALTCGLLLFLVIVRPIVRTDYSQLLTAIQVNNLVSDMGEGLQKTNSALTADIIAKETAAYIEDKAEEAGVRCTVAVECGEIQGLPVPERLIVSGTQSQAEQEAVAAIAEQELSLTGEAVEFQTKEGGA